MLEACDLEVGARGMCVCGHVTWGLARGRSCDTGSET